MKYYQCKNERALYYIYFVTLIIMSGFSGIVFVCNFSWEVSDSVSGGIFFLIIALIGIVAPIYMEIDRRFERTVEFTDEVMIYKEKKRTVTIKWEDVATVYLHEYITSFPGSRVAYFATKGAFYGRKFRVTNKHIWTEYNDEMLAEIKKYWHGRIVNEDKYLKYKNKKNHISSSGNYKYKQIFGNDDNRYFRFEIRPNALIYDEGDYAPNYITSEAYYTRFTTKFGWGENDTLWIYSSDTGIDYWKIEDGRWKKKQADEVSIQLAPERIQEMSKNVKFRDASKKYKE